MVHRNTEYKIKYFFPSEELSKKIWLDNIRFRESRRAMNLADHYWDFQTSNETCDCEDCLTSRTKCGIIIKKGDEKIDAKRTASNSSKIEKESSNTTTPIALSYREVAVQTPKWIPARTKELANLRSLPTTEKDFSSQVKERRSMEVKSNEHLPVMKKHRSWKSASSAVTSQNLMSRKHQNGHKMHSLFFPFGWNNDTKNIGDMKTFNIMAPQKEVHPEAVIAMRRKKAELEQFLLSQDEKKKQKSASLLSIPRINHSSIWITEYGDKFSKGFMTSR